MIITTVATGGGNLAKFYYMEKNGNKIEVHEQAVSWATIPTACFIAFIKMLLKRVKKNRWWNSGRI